MNNSALSVIAAIATVFSLIVAGVGAYLAPQFPLIWQVGISVAVVAAILFLVFEKENLKTIFSKKTTKYGLAASVMSLIVFAIVVFSNLIISNHDWRKDFTQNRIHSLSDQSIKIVGELKQDVVFKVFTVAQQKAPFEEFLNRYQYLSKHAKIVFVDVFREPQIVKENNINPGDGGNFSTIIIESSGRTSRVESIAGPGDPRLEEKLTNGLIKVLKSGKRKVYFVAGHVEKPLSKNTPDGLSRLKTLMEGSRYEVAELVLPKTDKMPADAEIVIIAGPKSQLFPHEVKLIEEYLQSGGRVLMMVDPESSPEAKPLLAKFGVEWNPKLIVLEFNPLRQLQAPVVPVVDVYDPSHEITKNFYAQSFYIVASSVEKAKNLPAELTATSLFSTSPASFEQEIKSGQRPDLAQAARKGPLSLAVAVTGKVKSAESSESSKADPKDAKTETAQKEFRLVVVGDSDFVTNNALPQGVNSDLFLNMMSWLANEEDLIAVRPKPADVRALDITEGRMRVVVLTTFIFLPLLAFVTAFVVRRNRRTR